MFWLLVLEVSPVALILKKIKLTAIATVIFNSMFEVNILPLFTEIEKK